MPETSGSRARARLSKDASKQHGLMGGQNPYRKIAFDLQRRVDEMHYSRTWQLTLALGLARRSFREFLRLPGRVWRILSRPPQAPQTVPYSGAPDAPSKALERREANRAGWPAARPLVSVVILSAADRQAVAESLASLRKSTLRDFEVLLVHGPGGETAGVHEHPVDAGREIRGVEASPPDSAAGRNAAVEAAEGKYVVLLRGGDRLDPTFLEKAAFALEDDTGAGFAYAKTESSSESSPPPVEPFGLRWELRYNHVSDCALFRRDVWAEAGGFRPDAQLDRWDFWVAAGTLGWAGLLLREELVRLGAESLGAQPGLLDASRDPREVDKILRRHAALLDAPPPSVAPSNEQPGVAETPGPSSGQTLHYSQRQFVNFSAGKPAILCVVPWLNVGGAEKVVLQIMRGLSDRFSFAVAATLEADHNRADEFRAITPWVYHLPESHAADPGRFLAGLAAMHGVRGVLVSSCEAGYRALPALKAQGLWTADIVHNTAPEGHLDKAIRFDREIDVHFACGNNQAEALSNAAGGGASRIRTVWTAVDAGGEFNPAGYAGRRLALRSEFGLQDGDVVIAYVGRLSIEKDVPLFIAAVSEIVRRHPGARIRALVAGDGPELLRVEQAVEREGLWNEVKLLGDTRRVPEILAVSDYMFLTSKTEGSPITILEAMSLKLVVLTTAVGNVCEVIENGVTGFVIDGRDPAAFADRFDEIRRGREREKRMREAARQTILERFDEPRMLASYAEVFAAALGPDAPGRSV
jgi:glycosyltransferase involved in cell wall biosynthesis